MAVFSNILDYQQGFLARLRNRRSHPRHAVGDTFPLKALVTLERMPWSGRIADISANGLNLLLPPAAAATPGESTTVLVTLEQQEFSIPCTVAHFRVQSRLSTLGLRLDFQDFKAQKAYQQIVETVGLGASFAPARSGSSTRRMPGLTARHWQSIRSARLTDWREGDGAPEYFDLILGDYRLEGAAKPLSLDVVARAGKGEVNHATETEVRLLYRWLVANLPKSMPADLRGLMAKLVKAGPAAAAVVPTTAADWGAPVPKTGSP